jgi:hypothetical protein
VPSSTAGRRMPRRYRKATNSFAAFAKLERPLIGS